MKIFKRICANVCALFLALCIFAPIPAERALQYLHRRIDGVGTDYGEVTVEAFSFSGGKDVLTVHFVDVDQAKAIVVTSPTGESMLVDAGSDASEPMLLSYLESIGVKEFELVVFTHPHEDHIGGADAVLKEYHAHNVMLPDLAVNTSAFENMLYELERQKKNGSRIVLPTVGDKFMLGDVSATVLSGHEPDEDNINNSSIVLKVQWHQAQVLLTGDAEAEIERKLLQNGVDLDADVLDMAHHGSNTSSTEAFLRAVSPKLSVISCGVDNSYGHPAIAVINRLNRFYIPFYRTDKQGTVVVRLDRNGKIDVEVSGK